MTQEENGQSSLNLDGSVVRINEMLQGSGMPSENFRSELTIRFFTEPIADRTDFTNQAEENDQSVFDYSDWDLSSTDVSDEDNHFERSPSRRVAVPLLSDHNYAHYFVPTYASEVDSTSTDIVISEKGSVHNENCSTKAREDNDDAELSSVNISEEDSDFEQKATSTETAIPVLSNVYESNAPIKVADEGTPNSKQENERDSDGDLSSVNVSEEDSEHGPNGIETETNTDFRNSNSHLGAEDTINTVDYEDLLDDDDISANASTED
eukprot:gene33565-43377_t